MGNDQSLREGTYVVIKYNDGRCEIHESDPDGGDNGGVYWGSYDSCIEYINNNCPGRC